MQTPESALPRSAIRISEGIRIFEDLKNLWRIFLQVSWTSVPLKITHLIFISTDRCLLLGILYMQQYFLCEWFILLSMYLWNSSILFFITVVQSFLLSCCIPLYDHPSIWHLFWIVSTWRAARSFFLILKKNLSLKNTVIQYTLPYHLNGECIVFSSVKNILLLNIGEGF